MGTIADQMEVDEARSDGEPKKSSVANRRGLLILGQGPVGQTAVLCKDRPAMQVGPGPVGSAAECIDG